MIKRRDEAIEAAAVGIGMLAQGLWRLSEVTRQAAVALERVAVSLAEQQEEEPSSSNGGTGATGPWSPNPSSPYESWTSSGPPPANP